ncbi:MAG: Flp pilus assembly complex ATPase component TadA [Dehalococcoidia bacterium]|nr:Flp pilus assembly complex ATPase component TadA [Dehalococcoidia bacterium]
MERDVSEMAMSESSKKSLGELLVENGLITAEQLDKALEIQKKQGGQLDDVLTGQRMVAPEDLAMVRSIHLNVPLIDLERHIVQPDAIRLIPEDMARKHTLIPLDIVSGALMVVMANPEDIHTIEDIRAKSGMRVDVALGIPSDIKRAIDIHYKSSGEIEKQVEQFAPRVKEKREIDADLIARTPVAQSLDLLITQAVRDRASDIHLEPQEDRLRVRYRIDGILRDVVSLPLTAHIQLVSRIKILAEMNIAEQRRPQDGQFSTVVGEREVDIRAATMETGYGEMATLRILDKKTSLFTLPELGFLPDMLEGYDAMLKSPFGMILVGGPTGSGKTTTLYASINQLDREALNILTIEDPIEYRFRGINQSQVNPKAGITFASGLRAIMRHDPDVILVGEIRDKDTAVVAVQAALTGHLVLSSIHANDATGVLFRLMDLGIEPYLISSTLVGILAQRMVRRLCPHCRVPVQASDEERAFYQNEMQDESSYGQSDTFYVGGKCHLCGHTGYEGRTGLFELMTMSDAIRKRLVDNPDASDIGAVALSEGMVTMKRDGIMKAKEGITSLGEVMRCVFSIG